MKGFHRLLTATACGCFFLASAVALSGCGDRRPPTPPPERGGELHGNWGIPLKEWKPEAGLAQAQAGYATWASPGDPDPATRHALVILSDLMDADGLNSGNKWVGGEHRSLDGRKVEWRAEMSDHKLTGPVFVSGQKYDLEHGSLFLVSTRGGAIQVLQLKRDLTFTGDHSAFVKKLETVIRADADLGPFFAKASQAKDAP